MNSQQYLKWEFGLFRIRLPKEKMHNLTIAIGLVVCMAAGTITVIQETLPTGNPKAKMVRNVRGAARSTRKKLKELCN